MVPREPLVQLFWLTAAIRRATNSLTNMSSAAQPDISDASLTKMSSAAQPDFNELPCIPADYSRLRITELNSLQVLNSLPAINCSQQEATEVVLSVCQLSTI